MLAQTINHPEALELASIRREHSNLARCYLDLVERLAALVAACEASPACDHRDSHEWPPLVEAVAVAKAGMAELSRLN